MDFFCSNGEELKEILDELSVNFHEDYHSLIESNAIHLLKKLNQRTTNYHLMNFSHLIIMFPCNGLELKQIELEWKMHGWK